MSSFSPPTDLSGHHQPPLATLALPTTGWPQPVRIFGTAIFLVVIPVFFQAPLVRSLPWLSLTLTGTWLLAGLSLASRSNSRFWGDLLVGFTWTWLAGSLYWGWFRWEPCWHLPLEAIGMPIVLILLSQGRGRIGSYFYLGSLLGTAATDLFVAWTDLFPVWRQVMRVDPDWVPVLLREAATTLQNPADSWRAIVIMLGLLIIGLVPLRSRQPCWWAFSGAVLSTLIVDLLFLGSAYFV